jgi:hypothetical protein
MAGHVSAPDPEWFLAGLGDGMTHCGRYSIASRSVLATCGIEFVPLRLPFGRLALVGNPPDPDQVCPQCRAQIRSQRARKRP